MTNPIIIENKGKEIIYWTRDENGKLIEVKDRNFSPYFYVEDTQGEHTSIYGEKAKKIIADDPRKVPKLRENFEKQGLKTFEADVKYTIRYSIDKFETPWEKVPIRVWYFDIEVMDSLDYINAPKPIISITIYDNFENKFYSLGYGKVDKKFEYKGGEIYIFTSEVAILRYFLKLLNEKDPDLLVAWNVKYDINYLVNRMRKLNINYNELSRLKCVILNENKEVIKIYGRGVIDLLKLYQKMKAKTSLESYSLENVAKYENLQVKKMKRPELKPENIMNVLAYNKIDVEIMVELDKKLGIISFWDELRRFVGLPWNDFIMQDYTISNKRLVDVYLLRKAKKKGIILPTQKEHEVRHYEGALVLQPPAGIFKNVVVLDIKSMYPNIIRTYNLSPETLDNNLGEINTPIGYKFRKNPIGLIPEACSELFELRKQYKKKMKEYLQEGNDEKAKEFDNKQTSVKIILNSLYGVMAYKGFRLFKIEVAETVTAFGRELLKHIINVVEKQGYKVLYSDTDSVFVKLPDNWTKEQCLNETQRLIEVINSSFDEFAIKWNVNGHHHEIELKFIFDRLAFFGVKKRYAGYYVNEEGVWKEGFEIKGLQIIRSDSNLLTKTVFQKVLEMLLREGKTIDEVLDYIGKIKEQIYQNKIPIQYLVWKVSYDPNKQYKNKNIPHLRGLNYAKKLGIVDNVLGKVVWIYIKNGECDVIAVPEDKIDVLNKFKIDAGRVIFRSLNNIEILLRTRLKGQMKLLST